MGRRLDVLRDQRTAFLVVASATVFVLDLALRAPTWLPFHEFVGQQAAWFQPAMWATLLLVGLATYRIITDASVTVSRPSLSSPLS